METTFSTPVEALQHKAQAEPERTAFIFLEQGEIEAERLTFGELDRQARGIAAYLQSISKPGDRALLIYPTGLDFVKAVYGCLYAGVIPIPTNPPGLNRSARRLDAIAKDADAVLILTTANFQRMFAQRDAEDSNAGDPSGAGLESLTWVDHASIKIDSGAAWRRPDLSPERLAFIQYTSGSTNVPKGVMISYRNLSYNRYCARQFRQRELSSDSVMLTWAPLFHDMGLIFGIFQSVYDGNLSLLMTPIAFIQRPLRWLTAITKYGVTFSGGPNFAYNVCVDKIAPEEYAGLDLSSWRMAYNGAEPVRAESHAAFAARFASCGFDPRAFHPGYGMAETTLLISGCGGTEKTVTYPVERARFEQGILAPCDPLQEKDCQQVVSCGPPLAGVQAVIVDPNTCRRSPDEQIGEIWVRGDNIAEGYWNRPEESQATFQARIAGTGEGPFLRTGDLGFMRQGEVYVTGRQKDLIIMRGRNYYPQDIEFSMSKSHPALRPGGGAAFSITGSETSGSETGAEQLVVVQEVRKAAPQGAVQDAAGWAEAIKAVRMDIARDYGIRAHSVVLIKPSTIPKTSSGKIMRSECRSLFERAELEIVAQWHAEPQQRSSLP